MAAILPEFLITYLEQRDAARAGDVTAVLAALTDRERALVKDAAVMGYVRGTMAPKGEPIPKDRAILAEVIDACLAFPDLYPAVCADPNPGADQAQQPTPCSQPNPCEDGELCSVHEEEQAHADGEHEYCGITCEVSMPSEPMRNFILAKGYPGTEGALNELLRRAAVRGEAL